MEKLLIIVCLLILLLLCNYYKQDWSSPASLNIIWNGFFLLFATVIFGGTVQWHYGGLFWILLSCLLFLIGQIMGGQIQFSTYRMQAPQEHRITNLVPLAIFCMILVGMLNPIIYLRAFHYSVRNLFNINALLTINGMIASDRYSGGGFESPLVVLIGTVSYFIALCGGYMFDICKSKIAKICMITTVFPMIMLTVITNAKVGTIAAVFLWVTGWIVSYLERNHKGIHISGKLLFYGLVIGIGFFMILYVSMMFRIGSLDYSTKLIVDDKMQKYAFGHIQAFSEWFHLRDFYHPRPVHSPDTHR